MAQEHPIPTHDRHCFACGEDNPGGLGLRFWERDETAIGRFTPRQVHQGAPGIAHGGALALAFDDTFGAWMISVGRLPSVTGRIEVDYERPALVGREIEIEVRLERRDGRKHHLHGEMRQDGERLARGRALFIAVDLEHFRSLGDGFPDHMVEWMQRD